MDITKELTVVIPVRIDCLERRENLNTVLYSLIETTNAFIIILEADDEQRYLCSEENDRVRYHFVKDQNPIFHRTFYINRLLEMAETNVIGIWDTDVILSKEQIQKGVREIMNGITLCYPYDGRFIFLNAEKSNEVRKNVFTFLDDKNREINLPLLGRPSVGGAFIVNKHLYVQAGGENENFYGWGPEDAERFKRMEILGEPISRLPGSLFHLYHPRGINSLPDSSLREKQNLQEFLRICRMDKINLEKEVKSWKSTALLTFKKKRTFKDILVSIIMPVYNTSLFLESTIQSILNQSYVDF